MWYIYLYGVNLYIFSFLSKGKTFKDVLAIEFNARECQNVTYPKLKYSVFSISFIVKPEMNKHYNL